MVKKVHTTQLEIPDGTNIELNDNIITVKGSKGELTRSFVNPRISIVKDGKLILIKPKLQKFYQADKMAINTYKAHIKNMIFGVNNGFTAKLKVCSGHFPMTVSTEGNNLSVKNFLGEKVPRKLQLINDVKVKIEGDIIVVTGLDKDKVGQTAASIEQLTRVTNRDRRIFQDGCFIISKPGDKDE